MSHLIFFFSESLFNGLALAKLAIHTCRTEEQLRDAYFRRAKELHPDVAGPGHEVSRAMPESSETLPKHALRKNVELDQNI